VEALVLRCPACGANAAPEDPRCAFCHAALATVACPRCFAAMFAGARHCSCCGAEADRAEVPTDGAQRCPRCTAGLAAAIVGGNPLRECGACGGLWLDGATFARVSADAERQSVLLGPPPSVATVTQPVRYLPCPACGKLMNRMNYARISGVVIDACKEHGLWFDRDELRQVVQFIRNHGLDEARRREKEELREERRRLAEVEARVAAGGYSIGRAATPSLAGDLAGDVIVEVLSWIVD
jgi:Zn-finger nucleic acid-binding protein